MFAVWVFYRFCFFFQKIDIKLDDMQNYGLNGTEKKNFDHQMRTTCFRSCWCCENVTKSFTFKNRDEARLEVCCVCAWMWIEIKSIDCSSIKIQLNGARDGDNWWILKSGVTWTNLRKKPLWHWYTSKCWIQNFLEQSSDALWCSWSHLLHQIVGVCIQELIDGLTCNFNRKRISIILLASNIE